MRSLFAVILFAVAGFGQAVAADIPAGRSSYYSGVRAPQLLIYDNQPGVYVRTYWAAPWENRHYYPFTGKKPKVGRHERMSAVRPAPKPAETYYREWSTAEFPPVERQRVFVPERIYEPPQYPTPLK
jgi:hypothetical protein